MVWFRSKMSKEERAEELMRKGPVWLVRRVMELEQELKQTKDDS